VPAPQVRKRVSRLRQHLRERWALDLSIAFVAITIATSLWYYETRHSPVPIAKEAPSAFVPEVSRLDKAKELRRLAFQQCENRSWQNCLDALDQAKELDRDGDRDRRVEEARRQALDGLHPQPPAPIPSAPPPPRPPRKGTAPKATSFGSSM